MPPATLRNIQDDIIDLFKFISEGRMNMALHQQSAGFRIDPNTTAIAGTSAGALAAAIAVMQVSPRPKAFLSIYGPTGPTMVSKSSHLSNRD